MYCWNGFIFLREIAEYDLSPWLKWNDTEWSALSVEQQFQLIEIL